MLELLADTPVPAPRLVAVEPPWLAMTLLPGALRLDAEAPEALARTLLAIHAVDPPQRPRDYYHWAYPERRRVPEWASDAAVWEWAFARHRPRPRRPSSRASCTATSTPATCSSAAREVTGVVDWVETSWGPADLDVAHCRTALAMLHGGAAADRFRAAYVARGRAADLRSLLGRRRRGRLPARPGEGRGAVADGGAAGSDGRPSRAARLEAYVSSLRASPSRS